MNMFAEPLENIVGMNKREGQFTAVKISCRTGINYLTADSGREPDMRVLDRVA